MIDTDKSTWPQWLCDAKTENARVEIVDGVVTWLGGTWYGGTWYGGDWHGGNWRGGNWHGGNWLGGTWHGGDWLGGTWYGGTWRCGDWHGGNWRGGNWHGGNWRGGTWLGGTWRDSRYDRLLYMSAMIGIVFDVDGWAVAYRSTTANGFGRYKCSYTQLEGEFHESEAKPAGAGTCCAGIHVSSAAIAWSYFGIDPTAQLWRVKFRRENLLDCDGQKARINGGIAEKLDWPFVMKGDEQ